MKISFIIPFHNEEKNCLPMVNRVLEFCTREKLDFEILPVNDRSNDKTAEILNRIGKNNPRIKPLHRRDTRNELGNTMGRALQEGTNHAKGELVIWTMGDMADDTVTYSQIIEKLKGEYDLVFGSRYMPGGSRGNLDFLKAILSSWGTILARILFGIQVHDITNAFRGFKKEVYDNLRLTSAGFSISPEFAIKAHLAGFKLGEVPTVYINRVEGVSNFKLYSMSKDYLKLYFDIFYNYKILGKKMDFIKAKKRPDNE